MKKKIESFEDGLARLEEIVAALEDRSTGLDQAMAAFKEGLELSRALKKKLADAAGKIELLSKDLAGQPVVEPLDAEGMEGGGDDGQ